MRRTFRSLWLVVAVAVAACSADTDSLVGEYSIKPGGPPLVKIARSGRHYEGSIRLGPDWSAPMRLARCTDADYVDQFGPGWKNVEPVGLRARRDPQEAYPFGIFKVRPGTQSKGRMFRTGYFVEFGGAGSGAGDLFKL